MASPSGPVLGGFLLLLLTGLGAVAASPPPPDRSAEIAGIVQEEIGAGHVPGAVIMLGERGRGTYTGVFGNQSLVPRTSPMRADAIFDIASLTKIFTATAVMQLVESGRLVLDRPVSTYWPEFGATGKEAVTVEQLLTHTAGLRPDLDTDEPWSGTAAAMRRVAEEKPVWPPGSEFLYSDIGFIALGELVRRASGEPLDVYVRRHIFRPLGMTDTGFLPPVSKRSRIVPTDRQDGVLRWGVVQDPTAYRMGGVAGDAGIFSTAGDLAKFAEMLLGRGSRKGVRILRPETVARMTMPITLPGGARRSLGWDIGSPYSVGMDVSFGEGSYGHTGYTGTSLWIDPRGGRFLVILTSRLHPDDRGDATPLRKKIAELIAPAPPPAVLPGIDVLAAQHFAPLAGKRIGLLTNQAARDRAGQRTIDRLATAPGVRLVALLTPEHGLSAEREGKIEGERDAATGLAIRSLYGATRKPTDEMLAGLDAVVIDLQDAGVRFFTYPTTVAYVLEAAARLRLEVYVLDRPDPINAAAVQGPVLDQALTSFTGYFPMPQRHGMTIGELARMFNAELGIGARLTVVPMQDYRRRLWYDETGLTWVDPSPNLRSVGEASLYAGVGLIEGANVSVGRGTASPFELVGAPWINGEYLATYLASRGIAGVHFERVEFTPEGDRYAGHLCRGVRIMLTDRAHFDAATLGLELAAALHRLYPERFELDATRGLVGSQVVFDALKSGTDPRDLYPLWKAQLRGFLAVRAKYLLYPY